MSVVCHPFSGGGTKKKERKFSKLRPNDCPRISLASCLARGAAHLSSSECRSIPINRLSFPGIFLRRPLHPDNDTDTIRYDTIIHPSSYFSSSRFYRAPRFVVVGLLPTYRLLYGHNRVNATRYAGRGLRWPSPRDEVMRYSVPNPRAASWFDMMS